jgi:predicted SprT family Zn-dependent metalloprotease
LTFRADFYILVAVVFRKKGVVMAQISKNARTTTSTHHFYCPCGGEIKMKTIFENGRVKNIAECEKCKRVERRPSDFK